MTGDGDDFESEFRDSGPFCRHWSGGGCDVLCARCGHTCAEHAQDGEGERWECDCPGWVEPPNEALSANSHAHVGPVLHS